MKKFNILVVEDEALIAASLVKTLSSLGYTVHQPVATGEEAIRSVKTQQPDLVLMDIQLIGPMDGIEAAEKIRTIADIPILYLTAYTDDQRLKKAQLTEPYGYIVKPANSRELHATIQMALYKHGLDKKLKESEERFRLTLDAINDGIWDWDIPTGTAFFSHRWYSMLGYAPDEMPGSYVTWRALIHPDDIGVAEQTIQDHLLRGGEGYRVEFRMRTKDGDWKWILSRGRVVKRDADYKPVRMLGTHTDITERKNTDAAFQAMISGMVGTTGFNSLQKITENINSWLGAECVMVGEIQSDRQTVKVLSMLLDGKNILNFSYRLKGTPCDNVAEKGFCIYPDNVITLFPGSKDLVDLNIRGYIGTPLRNSQGHVVGILCALFRNPVKASPAVQEIVNIIAVKAAAEIERKRAEESLNESARYTRNLIEVSLDPLVTISPEGKITDVNAATELVTGYSRDYLIGTDFSNYFTDLKKAHEGYRRVFDDGVVRDYPLEIRHRDGKTTPVLYNATIYRHESGEVEGVFAAARDITERKVAEEALHQANKKLNLLSSITRHDINNQLTVLMGYLAIINKKLPDPTLNEYFQKVATAAQRISSMIKFTKEYDSIGVNAAVWQDCRTVVDTAAKEAPLGQVVLKNDLPAGAEVFADPLIVKVFYNLMDNAARYGGKIRTIRFSVEEAGDDHLIVCEDDGDGVITEEKEKIFERGFGKNTGLGLALAREILDITGITIRETGEPGKGARFEMTVPNGAYRNSK